jgi:type III secretion protein L
MTEIALADSQPILTAVAGQRIPRHAWANVNEMSGLINEAGRILQTAKRQAELLQRRAYYDGRAAGAAQAQAEAIKHVLDAQRQVRELINASEARIVELAVSIVAHIAPRLDQGELIAALAAKGMAALCEERHVCIRFGQAAEKSMRSMLDKWQTAHPEFGSVELLVDPQLDPLTCVIETELGRIEVGLAAQLEGVRSGLLTAIAGSSS